jgi:hypothetical protein
LMVDVRDVMDALEETLPAGLEPEGGPWRLLVGSERSPVKRVMCAVELSGPVVEAATSTSSQLLIAHRTHLLDGIAARIDTDAPAGRIASTALGAGLNIARCGEGAEAAIGGTADLASRHLGLRGAVPLKSSRGPCVAKVVVFVPDEALEAVFEAMARAGAGASSRYTHASFRAGGTGTFFPGEGANPYSGEKGRLNMVEETRLEMACPVSILDAVIGAMLAEHPYEEVAYDVYRTDSDAVFGRGRIGDLEQPGPMEDIMEDMAAWCSSEDVVLAGDPRALVSRVAVAPGNGDDLVEHAWRKGAEALVTGELSRRAALEAREAGMALLTLGCVESERPLVGSLVEMITGASEAAGWGLEVEGYRDWRGIWG